MDAVENLKKLLSSDLSSSSSINIVSFLPDGKDFKSTLSRAKLEFLCSDLFQKTITGLDQVLKDADLSKTDIDEVILVGGSTKIPKIRKLVKEYFNNKVTLK